MVINGVDAVCEHPDTIGYPAIGLFTNVTGTTRSLRRGVDALLEAGLPVRALFGPEHGLRGSVQAGQTESETVDEATGLPVHETYEVSSERFADLIAASGVDALLFDMQDVGVRYYTYIWSMFDGMRAAAQAGIPFVVLDRPNPLGGRRAQGPGIAAGHESFLGRTDVPLRHGLTAGELAGLFRSRLAAEGTDVSLEVVRMSGWQGRADFPATGLPWVPLSPNMPTLTAAYAYAATGLLEGTNISEGRGTTKPFELFGAPFFDARLLPALRDARLPGVLFREAWYTPAFGKYAGQTLRGIQLHIVDTDAFDPLLTILEMFSAISLLYGDRFAVLEAADDAPFRPIDRLWGDATLGDAITNGRVDVEDFYQPATDTGAGPYSDFLLYQGGES